MDPICTARYFWLSRWDCGNTASDLAVSLFRFRHSASSRGLAALLAKPQSNHLNLLCALRGHPVTLSEALNMSNTVHVDLTLIENINYIYRSLCCMLWAPLSCKNEKLKSFQNDIKEYWIFVLVSDRDYTHKQNIGSVLKTILVSLPGLFKVNY